MDTAWLMVVRCRWFIVTVGPGIRRDDVIFYAVPQPKPVIPAEAGIHTR
jgi:hypothetical protein